MERMLKAVLGLALAAGLMGANLARAATDAPAADPPPPANLENPAVEAWADTYLKTEGWTLLAHNYEGAHLTSHRGALKPRGGKVELEIRTELFHPVPFSRGEARSGIARWSVDCAKKQLAILSMTAYAHNNMQGELGKKTVGVSAWRAPNEGELDTFSVICSAAKAGTGFVPRGLGPPAPT